MLTRAEELQAKILQESHEKVDQMFLLLLPAQWAVGVVFSLTMTPYTWDGSVSSLHPHVLMAIGFGGLINAAPIALIRYRRGWWVTRHVVTVAQMLWSGLLIHLSGGRVETHFHIFGSLAFIAYYRDWKLLPTATVVVVVDHLARGMFWPESIYGVANPEWWRLFEHSAWVLFEDVVLYFFCRRSVHEAWLFAQREEALEMTLENVEVAVSQRTQELASNIERYRALIENTNAMPFECNLSDGRLSYIAPQASKYFDCAPDSRFIELVFPEDRTRVTLALRGCTPNDDTRITCRMLSKDGRDMFVAIVARLHPEDNVVRGLLMDETSMRTLEAELRQSQKLESVGRLAAGVAHEINTPVQFVSDNVHFLKDAFADLGNAFTKIRAQEPLSEDEEDDIAYVFEKAPNALDRSLEGLGRVATIVRSMKDFAHPDQKEKTLTDLNKAIMSTLVIAKNEYKYVAEVQTELGDLPMINCHAGEVNQVVLNLIVNAAHAIGDVVKGTEQRGLITVRTSAEDDSIVISVADTGTGIPDHIRERIFDPFFTTKEVGKGTGQGLAIARSVVVDKHGGNIWVDSTEGNGSTFYIRLPIESAKKVAA